MPSTVHDSSDAQTAALAAVLSDYERDHPGSSSQFYRENRASLRVRVIDDSVEPLSRHARHRLLWQYIAKLPLDIQEQITLLLIIPSSERAGSMASFEFDVPQTLETARSA